MTVAPIVHFSAFLRNLLWRSGLKEFMVFFVPSPPILSSFSYYLTINESVKSASRSNLFISDRVLLSHSQGRRQGVQKVHRTRAP